MRQSYLVEFAIAMPLAMAAVKNNILDLEHKSLFVNLQSDYRYDAESTHV